MGAMDTEMERQDAVGREMGQKIERAGTETQREVTYGMGENYLQIAHPIRAWWVLNRQTFWGYTRACNSEDIRMANEHAGGALHHRSLGKCQSKPQRDAAPRPPGWPSSETRRMTSVAEAAEELDPAPHRRGRKMVRPPWKTARRPPKRPGTEFPLSGARPRGATAGPQTRVHAGIAPKGGNDSDVRRQRSKQNAPRARGTGPGRENEPRAHPGGVVDEPGIGALRNQTKEAARRPGL